MTTGAADEVSWCLSLFHVPGCLLQKGCGGGQNDFVHITTSGEYMLFCKANASSSVF